MSARTRARADTDAGRSLVISADDVDHRLQASRPPAWPAAVLRGYRE
jgi:hypothetical protein